MKRFTVTAPMLLRAYANGLFPMAASATARELHWFDPEERGVLPLDGFHLPRRLARTARSDAFEIRIDSDFAGTMRRCAAPAPGREETWINDDILSLYAELHAMGHAHSVETWAEGEPVGGLYGVALGGAFFGESMFSRRRDASKVALVHLVARLALGGFVLLDTQFVTEHLMQFGAVEIPRDDYLQRLAAALPVPARWDVGAPAAVLEAWLAQRRDQGAL